MSQNARENVGDNRGSRALHDVPEKDASFDLATENSTLENPSLALINGYKSSMFDAGRTLDRSTKARIADSVNQILTAIGPENLDEQGTQRTPLRVAEMFDELLSGYSIDPQKLLNGALFDVEYDQMVVVKSIEYYSLCEHHLLPFYGYAHVGYIPNKKVIGLSKIPRIVDMFARRLQVQERMTQEIASFLDSLIEPNGVGVVVEGTHMCTVMRGVRKQDPKMVTSAVMGSLRDNAATRDEFMEHLRNTAV